MSKFESQPEARILTSIIALEVFGNPEISLETCKEALTVLIASKYLPKRADDAEIHIGRDRLLRDAVAHADPANRLLAIAEAIRLARVVKRWWSDVAKELEKGFDSEIPRLSLLTESDDRLNVARACALFKREWLPEYLARAIAEEEQGETARAAMVEAFLEQGISLADGLRLLAQQFGLLRPTTEVPGDTIAKRLTRTLSALRVSVVETENDAGEDLGKALHALIGGSLAAVGKPQDDKAKVELCREVILTVHDMVRTRISVAAESGMYQAVGYCRQLCGGANWPAELQKPLDRLVTDVTEALVLLGRQGQCDQSLLGQLEVLCNNSERARFLAKNLAARHPELSEDVRYWLERGRMRSLRPASNAAVEAAARNADASIGLALESARVARQLSEGLRNQLISSLEIYEPSLLSVTQECMDRIKVLAVQVEQAAGLRSLGLLGQPGQEIDMSVKYFEAVEGNPRQRMVVKQPAVVKLRADGTTGDVVLRGLVE